MSNYRIQNTQTGDILNIEHCARIKKSTYTWDDTKKTTWYIRFEWVKDSAEMIFDTEKERDNFFSHIQNLLKPLEIDPKQKSLKL